MLKGLCRLSVNFRQIASNLSVRTIKCPYESELSTVISPPVLRKPKPCFAFLKFTLSYYRHKQSKRLLLTLANYRFSNVWENRYVLCNNTICAKSNCEARQKVLRSYRGTFSKVPLNPKQTNFYFSFITSSMLLALVWWICSHLTGLKSAITDIGI